MEAVAARRYLVQDAQPGGKTRSHRLTPSRFCRIGSHRRAETQPPIRAQRGLPDNGTHWMSWLGCEKRSMPVYALESGSPQLGSTTHRDARPRPSFSARPIRCCRGAATASAHNTANCRCRLTGTPSGPMTSCSLARQILDRPPQSAFRHPVGPGGRGSFGEKASGSRSRIPRCARTRLFARNYDFVHVEIN